MIACVAPSVARHELEAPGMAHPLPFLARVLAVGAHEDYVRAPGGDLILDAVHIVPHVQATTLLERVPHRHGLHLRPIEQRRPARDVWARVGGRAIIRNGGDANVHTHAPTCRFFSARG